MKTKTYRAFDDTQLALLKSLLTSSATPKTGARHGLENGRQRRSESPHEAASVGNTRTPGKASGLLIDPGHAQRAEGGDFSWVPNTSNAVIEHMVQGRTIIKPRRDQLVVLGHIYWRRCDRDAVMCDTVITGTQLTKVVMRRVDPAVEHALLSTRLAWIAITKNGEPIGWDPAYMRITPMDASTGSRHLHLRAIQSRFKAINLALRSGTLCVALLSPTVGKTRTASTGLKKINSTRDAFPKRKRPIYIPVAPISSTNYDGSALVAAPGRHKPIKKKSRDHALFEAIAKDSAKPKKKRGRYLGLEICGRCAGGELPNCPRCDGTGYFKLYEGDTISAVRMSSGVELSGSFGVSPNPGQVSQVPDHEAVGRADPSDANRGAAGMLDSGRFGSMPLHDNYDD